MLVVKAQGIFDSFVQEEDFMVSAGPSSRMFPLVHNFPIFIAQYCKDKSVFQHSLRLFGICSNTSKSNSAAAGCL